MRLFQIFFAIIFLSSSAFGQKTNELPLYEALFFANVNGVIENCNCGSPPLGAMERIATYINKTRKKNPKTHVLLGGNFLNTYPFPELNEALIKTANYIKVDVWALNAQDFIEGMPFLTKQLPLFLQDKLLTSNYKINGLSTNSSKMFGLNSGRKVVVTSYVAPVLLNSWRIKKEIVMVEKDFNQTIQSLKNSDLNIVIFHGNTDQLNRFRASAKNVDLILWAKEHYLRIIEDIEKPWVIGGGADAEHLQHIKVWSEKEGYRISVKKVPIKLEIAIDKKVQGFIDSYKKNIKR